MENDKEKHSTIRMGALIKAGDHILLEKKKKTLMLAGLEMTQGLVNIYCALDFSRHGPVLLCVE